MKRPQLVRIVPPPASESGHTTAQGTKVYVGDQLMTGVTKIEITCEVGDLWRAVIHCHCQPADLSAAAVVHVPTFWQWIKLWWKNRPPARDGGPA